MKTKLSVLTFFICTIFSMSNINCGIMESILEQTKSSYVESGLVLDLTKVEEYEVENIEKTLELFKDEYEVSIDKTPLKEEKRIQISILSTNNNINLNNLKNDIVSKLNVNNKDIKARVYYKGKLKDDNIKKDEVIIKKILVENKCKYLKSSPIKNGIVGTAYSGKYDYIETKEGRVDISFALCKYKSGTYIIIGSPVITCGY